MLVYAYMTMNCQNVLAALVDPTRREVFELLRSGPRAVGELAEHVPVSRPAVSQHLRVLRDARLVQCVAEGKRRVYSIDPSGLEELDRYLSSFWGDALEAFRQAAERRLGQLAADVGNGGGRGEETT